MSRFDPSVFADPPNQYRPLQIVHGFDRFLKVSPTNAYPEEASEGAGDEADPAGDWAARLQEGERPTFLTGATGIDEALERLATLGLGGVVANVGFQDYLTSAEQWEVLRYGQRRACALGLRTWLYDEKGYPSGTAGGIVPRALPGSVALGLACYVEQYQGPCEMMLPQPVSCAGIVSAAACRDPDRATRADLVDLSAEVDEWGVLRWSVPEGAWHVLTFAERVMYEGTHAQGNVSAFRRYINLLDPEAVRAFLRVTHEAYARELPADLWEGIEALFTDEPSLMTFYVPALPERYWGQVPVVDAPRFEDRPPAVPWRAAFLDDFRTAKGYDLAPYLYALFFSQADEACYVRQDYYDFVTRCYVDAFYGQVQAWCRAHGVASSGHVLLEENILDHVPFHGSLFAAVRKMDLPGIDMLNSDPQEMLHGGSFMGASFMAVKQVSSVAHLTGCERVHSESSDWEQRNVGRYASLAQRRGQANLQHVLGVNQITSYFGWQEFTDEEQRAYHDYVGRLGALLTGGHHVCDVAVLYPIRTLWAHYLPLLTPIPDWFSRAPRSLWETQVAEGYPALVRRLLCSQIDVDIIDEAAVLAGDVSTGALQVADEVYRTIVLPPIDALDLATVRVLAAFCRAGGTLLAIGPLPTMAGTAAETAELRAEVAALFGAEGPARTVSLDAMPDAVRQAVPPDVSVQTVDPARTAALLVTHRVLNDPAVPDRSAAACRHVYFVINNHPEPVTFSLRLREPGPYARYCPLTGEVAPADPAGPQLLEGYAGAFYVSSPVPGHPTP